jgi:hypothetical protein
MCIFLSKAIIFVIVMKHYLFTIALLLLISLACTRRQDEATNPDQTTLDTSTESGSSSATEAESIVSANYTLQQVESTRLDKAEPQVVVRTEGVGRLSHSTLNEIPARDKTKVLDGPASQLEIAEPVFQAFTSLNRYFMVHFENDIFAERDQYYTNGVAFTWIHPYFQFLPITRNLPGLGRQSVNHYGLHLRQMMFTPIHPETDVIVPDDRPFAGALYLGFFRTSVLNERRLRLHSEILIGTIGPRSLAETFQRGIHEKEPNGWIFQIQNDLLINFNLSLEKTLVSLSRLDAGLHAGFKAGSLHTNVSGGLYARYGSFAPYFSNFGTTTSMRIDSETNRHIQYWFYGRASGNLIAYDATLNGGLFNKTSPHTFNKNQVKGKVFEAEMGGVFVYKQYGVQFSYTYLSPEFESGREHFWGSIKLFYIY